jgi:hypothetical protein
LFVSVVPWYGGKKCNRGSIVTEGQASGRRSSISVERLGASCLVFMLSICSLIVVFAVALPFACSKSETSAYLLYFFYLAFLLASGFYAVRIRNSL